MREIEVRAVDAYRRAFAADPALVASAPGRVNLIGEHTDYSGGLALPCAIDLRVAVAMGEGTRGLYSVSFDAREPLDGCRGDSWAAYPRGVAWALAEKGYSVGPFQAAIAGGVPIGSGLSSSAAVECATGLALVDLAHLQISRRELALICQRAENRFVGVNSGLLDQYASLLCREGEALLIDFRTLETENVPLHLESVGLRIVVCDTRVERELSNTGYNDRREAVERAAKELEVPQLRDADLAQVEGLPARLRMRARHVVSENIRVQAAVAALRASDFESFGRLMYESHQSLRNDFEVSTPHLDLFVECAHEAGALGARLTGAGFGGCAVALISEDRVERLQRETIAEFNAAGYQMPVFYSFYPAPGASILTQV